MHRPHRVVVALAAALVVAPLFAQRRSPPLMVRRVIDGDTIDVATIGRVQLLGVTAQRLARRLEESSPLAREAQQRLSGLLANRWVRLEYEDSAAERAGGGAAYVFLEDGRMVNAWVLREGLARVAARKGLRLASELSKAEAEAKAARRGVWRDSRSP